MLNTRGAEQGSIHDRRNALGEKTLLEILDRHQIFQHFFIHFISGKNRNSAGYNGKIAMLLIIIWQS